MSIYRKLAERLLSAKTSSPISGEFDFEQHYRLRDKISAGIEFEEVELGRAYNEEEKLDSATGFLTELLTEEEAAQIIALKK